MPGLVQTQTAMSKQLVTHNRRHKKVVLASLLDWLKHSPKHK